MVQCWADCVNYAAETFAYHPCKTKSYILAEASSESAFGFIFHTQAHTFTINPFYYIIILIFLYG